MKRALGFVLLALTLGVIASSFAQPQPAAQEAKAQPERGRGYVPLSAEKRAAFHAHSQRQHGGRITMLSKNRELPPAFDCRAKGWVLPIGDQGQCGSCYLYSTIYGTLTSAFVKAGYGKPDGSFVMAVQYGMDCHSFGGCGGGNGTEVIDWAVKNGWFAEKWVDSDGKTHNDYPGYDARSRSCRKVAGAKAWTPASWGYVSASSNRPATTLEIKTALVAFGPLNVSLDAGGQFQNGTGTITRLGGNIDHEIELVAYDDSDGTFLLKNQWTTDWGNNGYRKITYAAAQGLVDVFFVTAAQLPPPPDPPIPPIPPVPPTPGSPTITLGADLKAGKYQIVPNGSIVLHEGMTLTELKEALDLMLSKKSGGTIEPPQINAQEQRLDRLERTLDKLLEIVGPPKK